MTGSIRIWVGSDNVATIGRTTNRHININSSGNVGIGTGSLHASAALQVDSISKGLLPPRMTTAQRLAIASPVDGLIVFDTTEIDLFIQSEQGWVGVTSSLGKGGEGGTFLDDWPDAIYCLGSSWDIVLYVSFVYDDGRRYYSTPWGSSYGVLFDSDGLYSSHTSNLANVDCVSNAMGIDQLEDLDRTFNLVGGGGSDNDNDNVWTSSGGDIYLDSGNVGIGTDEPENTFHVRRSNTGTSWEQAAIGADSPEFTTVAIRSDRESGNIGAYEFYDSDNNRRANIVGHVDGSIRFRHQTSIRMIIEEQGNVGIGTSSSSGLLEISDESSSGNSKVKFGGSGGGAHHLSSKRDIVFNSDSSGGAFYFRSTNYDDLSDYTGIMSLLSDGNVGIGTTNPSELLEVVGNIKGINDVFIGEGVDPASQASGTVDIGFHAGRMIHFYRDVDTNSAVIERSSGSGNVELRVAGTTGVHVNSSGNVGIGTTNPESRLEVSGGNISFDGVVGARRIQGGSSYTRVDLHQNKSHSDSWSGIEMWGDGDSRAGELMLYGNYISLRTGSTDTEGSERALKIDSNGNVGIGTINPEAKLDVSGEVWINEFQRTLGTIGIQHGSNGEDRWRLSYAGFSDEFTPPIDGYRPSDAGLRIEEVDNGNTLVWFGYGNSPLTAFQYNVQMESDLIVDDNVGIGTTNSTKKVKIDVSENNDGISVGDTVNEFSVGLFSNYNGPFINFDNSSSSNDIKTWIQKRPSTHSNPNHLKISNGDGDIIISSSNNVGIGTTNPSVRLEVAGSVLVAPTPTTGAVYLGSTWHRLFRDATYDLSLIQGASSANSLYLGSLGDVVVSLDTNDNQLNRAFRVTHNSLKSGTELLRVQEDGNVGIGTTNPRAKLDIVPSGSAINSYRSADIHIGGQMAPSGTEGEQVRLAIQPYGHTGVPLRFFFHGIS